MIANKDLPVNEELPRSTVIRVVHNRENPFVQLNKQALWDPNLSLRAVGLWARCLSRPNNWKFSIKELVSKCKEGRHSLDSAMKELIKANYVVRLDYYEKGADGKFQKNNGGVEYVFFEFPATQEEKDEQLEIFKKSFRDCGFRDCGFRDPGNPHLLIKSSKQTESKQKERENTPPNPPQPEPAEAGAADAAGDVVKDPQKLRRAKAQEFSPEVKELAAKMIAIIMRCNAVYRPPDNLDKFHSQVQMMLEKDKQDPEILLRTFEWACSDSESRDSFKGWQSVVCTNKRRGKVSTPAEIFRGHYSTIYAQMNSQPKRKFAPSSNDAKSLEKLEEWSKSAI
jgi:hypothetical protein